jgi:hypothetical protein
MMFINQEAVEQGFLKFSHNIHIILSHVGMLHIWKVGASAGVIL